MNLDQLEQRLKTLIEVDLLRYFPIKQKEGAIAQNFAKALPGLHPARTVTTVHIGDTSSTRRGPSF